MKKKILSAACLTSALAFGIASAAAPGEGLHATGTIVSVDPAPPEEAKSVVVKTDAGEVKYVISEAADVTPGLKPGDVVTVEYVDHDGIHWADTVKTAAGKSARPKAKSG